MDSRKAYAHGVLDGFNIGDYNNPYNPEQATEYYQAYKEGYDYGVFVYTFDLQEKEALA